jgi:hypothetical protein
MHLASPAARLVLDLLGGKAICGESVLIRRRWVLPQLKQFPQLNDILDTCLCTIQDRTNTFKKRASAFSGIHLKQLTYKYKNGNHS